MKTLFRLTFVLCVVIFPMVLHAQWDQLKLFQNPISETRFYNIHRGAVISGSTRLLVTQDGGITFDTAFYRSSGFLMQSLNLTDSINIRFVVSDKLFHSADFGITWDSIMLPQPMSHVRFLNDTVVYGRMGNSVQKSLNGGSSWTPVLSGLSTIWFTHSFHHPDTGYVQINDTLHLTTDGGNNWQIQTAPTGYNVQFVTDSVWYGYRGTISDSLYIIQTTNRGLTWSGVIWQGYLFHGFSFVNFVNETTGYIGGRNHIQATINGGVTWMNHHVNTYISFCDMVMGTYFLNADTGYAWDACGYLYRTTHGTDSSIYVTTLGINHTNLYEPCGKAILYVRLNNPATDTMVVHFDAMFGTATNGVDFVHIPDSAVFMPGMDVVHIPIEVIDDTLVEGPEFFSVVIHNTLFNDTATFWIHDEVPVPLSYQLNPPERFVCPNATQAGFTANVTSGAWPYTVIWYDTSGILAQQHILPNQPVQPYHRTIYVEISDNAMCHPLLDSVKLWYFDSCKVVIQSSYSGPVPVGVPVTYTLVHECATAGLNNRWLINGSVYTQNANQIVYTWSSTGQQQVNFIADHICGNIYTGIAVDVVTGIGTPNSQFHLHLIPLENRTWQITGEQLPAGITLRIFDMKGQLTGQHPLATDGGYLNYTLDLNHLTGGIYMLDIVSENGFRQREKIVCW